MFRQTSLCMCRHDQTCIVCIYIYRDASLCIRFSYLKHGDSIAMLYSKQGAFPRASSINNGRFTLLTVDPVQKRYLYFIRHKPNAEGHLTPLSRRCPKIVTLATCSKKVQLLAGLEHSFFHILGIIIPIDSNCSEGLKPPTSQIQLVYFRHQITRFPISSQAQHERRSGSFSVHSNRGSAERGVSLHRI